MRYLWLGIFILSLSSVDADLSFHYIADLDFFYQERGLSLQDELQDVFGQEVLLEISGGILGVYGSKHQTVAELLQKLRVQERQQVHYEFILFTSTDSSPYPSSQFISGEQQKQLLETLSQKHMISRTLVPSRRGVPIVWSSEKQEVLHTETSSVVYSLEVAKILFQGARLQLQSTPGGESLRFSGKLHFFYTEGETQEEYTFEGTQIEDQNAIWFVPFKRGNRFIYALVNVRPFLLPEIAMDISGKKVEKSLNSKPEAYKKIYRTWSNIAEPEGGLADLTQLYQTAPKAKEKEVQRSRSCIEFFQKLIPSQYPMAKIQDLQNFMEILAPEEAHQLIAEALDLQDSYGSHQAYLDYEEIFVSPKFVAQVYQESLPLMNHVFSKEEFKAFLKKLEPAPWFGERHLESQICMNRHSTWNAQKQETGFLKGFSYEEEQAKCRTQSDTLSYGKTVGIQAVLMGSGKEYYLCYDYQRNLFDFPLRGRRLSFGENLQLTVQEPILYRETFQIRCFLPKGKFQCIWGLPLNLSSGPTLEKMLIFYSK